MPPQSISSGPSAFSALGKREEMATSRDQIDPRKLKKPRTGNNDGNSDDEDDSEEEDDDAALF